MTVDSPTVTEATDETLAECFDLRRRVFVYEQGVDRSLEFDGLDDEATHLAAHHLGQLVGTARFRLVAPGVVKAERVAVSERARQLGVGRALMQEIERLAAGLGSRAIVLNAQKVAIPFYRRLGYSAEGAPFDEAGIPHVAMRKVIHSHST